MWTFRNAVVRTALFLVLSLSAAVQAQAEVSSLRETLFGSPAEDSRRGVTPPLARYVSEAGEGFVLDQTSPKPLLRFEGSPEVWVLDPHYAPRGDIVYKNDLGQVVLRASRVGGVTLFTPERPMGAAAAPSGSAGPLRLLPLGPQQLLRQLAAASARASRAARKLITVEADATPEGAPVIADAATVAAEAVVRISRRTDAKDMVLKISRIAIEEGQPPGVSLRDGTLKIVVYPPRGMAGRPSSERIVYAFGAR
jgi:hypothetical protein